MADEEVMGSASPAPSDHKRKLDELDSEPFEQPPVSAGSNGNSQSVADADGDAAPISVSTDDPEVKRPRLDDNPHGIAEATENGHQEERPEEPKEDITEPSAVTNIDLEEEPKEDITEPSTVMKKTESEEHLEKASEPLDAVNKESETDEPHADYMEPQSTENPDESAKEEHQELGVEQQDPTPDVYPQGDLSALKEQPTFSDKSTSRRMEVPSNKVGVLIGKAGDTIRTLQYSSGARIQITRDSEADPNSATRPVEIIGSIENINKAERLIKEVIAEADAGGSPSLVARGFSAHSSGIGEQIHLQVPNEKVGVIIGKGGETIKNLQTRSGARIQLIPQHLPEGDQSKERTVRVTGDRKQIEAAKEMIQEVMDQPIRSSNPSGGNNHPNYRSRGSGGPHWGGGPRGGHASLPTGYNNYPQRGGPYPSQNPPYGNYPPQQPPPKNNYGWDQRPPTNMQGPPEQTGYDYYGGGGQGGHMAAPSPQPPMHSHAPGPGPGMGPPYNYGQPQGPDYGQQPAPYPQTAPPQGGGGGGYGQGYREARYDHQGPYGGQGNQPSTYPQGTTSHPGYGQQDQYGKPPASYNMPPQGPYVPPYGPPPQQPYPASSGPPMQQPYPQYGAAPAPAPAPGPGPVVNDGYGHSATAPGGGYGQQGGQPVSGYAQQQAAPGYAQAGPTGGYGQYPSTQPGYTEQAAPSSGGYGYQGAADSGYGGGAGMGFGAPPPVQPAYSQPAPVHGGGYEQSMPPQTGGYATPQPQAGYGQYDGNQMYAGHR